MKCRNSFSHFSGMRVAFSDAIQGDTYVISVFYNEFRILVHTNYSVWILEFSFEYVKVRPPYYFYL